jgi:hypothetical protein
MPLAMILRILVNAQTERDAREFLPKGKAKYN